MPIIMPPGGAAPVPVTVVSYLNTLNATTITNSGLNNHLDRWPHFFPQAVNWFKFRWNNWYLPTSSTGPASNPGNSFTFNSAYATYNGVRVALKAGGAPLAGQTVADGGSIDCDPLHPPDFGFPAVQVQFPAGAVPWTTADIALGNGVLCVGGATVTGSTDLNSQLYGAKAQFYNPANTTVTINADGTISTTGTAPANSTFGLRPICIGQLAVARNTWGLRADSTGFGYNDLTPSLAGTGWFQRALLLLGCPGFNMAITGGNALNGITDARVTACYSLFNRAVIGPFGANDFSYPSGGQAITVAAMQTRVTNMQAQMKAAGVAKVAIAKILPVTTDTTNTWATESNQVIKPGWGAGSYEDQYNQSLPTLGFDLVLPMAACRGVTSPFVWRSNGATGGGGVTVDGIHPAAFATKALAAEAAPLMLSIMDAVPLPPKMQSQAQLGAYVLSPAAAWSYTLLEGDLRFCVDAEQAGTVTQSGGIVSAWADFVTGLSLAAVGSPAYSASSIINSRPAIVLDGATEYFQALGIGNLPTTGPFEIWALVNQQAPTSDSTFPLRTVISWGDTGSGAIQLNRQLNGGVNRAVAQIGDGTTTRSYTNTMQDFSGNCVLRLQVSEDDVQLEINGHPSPLNCLPTFVNNTRVRIGGNNLGSASGLFNGPINFVAVTNPLSEANHQNMTSLLKGRAALS